MQPGVNLTKVLREAFTPVDPESVNIQLSHQYFLCSRDLRAQKLYVER